MRSRKKAFFLGPGHYLLEPECQCGAFFRMKRSRHRLSRPLFYVSWIYQPRWSSWFGLGTHTVAESPQLDSRQTI